MSLNDVAVTCSLLPGTFPEVPHRYLMQALKVLLLTWLFLLFQSTGARAMMSDREFFNSLNLDYAGLDSVKSALIAGDTTLAKAKLLAYFQNRNSVRYFALSEGGDVGDANDNLDHYFTVIGIRKYAGDSDGTIDWRTYDSRDKEWHYQFHRMYWLVNLAKVYGRTKDEKYAAEWIAELIDWRHDNAPGYPRTLDTGVRLRNWVESYQYFIHKYHSPSITPEDHTTVLKSIIEQCRFLRDNWRSEGNWGAAETRGLGAAVIMFPEFKMTPDGTWQEWRNLVISRLQHHLTGDFYSDGVQFETSPAYHSLEYRNLFLTYQLMHLNNISISEALLARFIKPLEFMMYIHKPDGYVPQLSDTDRKSFLSRLKEGGETFSRDDMIYAATRGQSGTPPANTFAAFPDGGYFVMRSDWGQGQRRYQDSKYLVFDTGSNAPWHAHYDILNFEAYANGSVLVRDPGRYTYVSGSWRDYFKNTTAHNTIVIDGQNQKRNASGHAIHWASLPGFDYVAGSHQAYTGLTHERRIFFVKPDYWIISDLVTGNGSHTYDLYFHLDSPYLGHYLLNEQNHSVATPNFLIMPSDTAASVEVTPGWVSNSYNKKQQAPVVRYQKTGAPPMTFETLLYPFNGKTNPVAVEKSEVFWGQGSVASTEAFCLKIQLKNSTDWFFHSGLSPDTLTFGDFLCNAKAALIRLASDHTLSGIQLLQGSLLYKVDTLLVNTDSEIANVSWFQHGVFVNGESVQKIKIWAPQTDSVIVNGRRVEFAQNGNYVEFNEATSIRNENRFTAEIVNDFHLSQNYPNPFNHSTVIRFVLSKRDFVRLRIFDLLGHEVITLLVGVMESGEHTIKWDGRDKAGRSLAGGIYLYRLKVGNQSTTKRMLFIE